MTQEEDTFSNKMSDHHIRIAVVGNVDAGKSTLIGSLVSGILDDGRGSARSRVTKHQHEIETGRTSTITSHLLGFDASGQPVPTVLEGGSKSNHKSNNMRIKDMNQVAQEAEKTISLLDLAGHEKYLKTTIQGISAGFVDYALVLVNSRHVPTHMTIQHFHLTHGYGIPPIVILTKVDGCPTHEMKNTKQEVFNIVRSMQKKPFMIHKASDISIVKEKMHALAPVVSVSSVSGEGLDLLCDLLHALPKRRWHKNKIDRTFEFLVEDLFNITGVGSVVSGFVNAGRIGLGQQVFVGPLDDGSYMTTMVKSIHLARTHVRSVVAGNNACLALALNKNQRKLLRKGMVVLEEPLTPSMTFEAEMVVVKGSGVDGTTIKEGYQTMVHILHVKQPARIEKIEKVEDAMNSIGYDGSDAEGIVIRPGDHARIRFRFLNRSEFIRKGMKVLFRDGHVRGCGIINDVSL